MRLYAKGQYLISIVLIAFRVKEVEIFTAFKTLRSNCSLTNTVEMLKYCFCLLSKGKQCVLMGNKLRKELFVRGRRESI